MEKIEEVIKNGGVVVIPTDTIFGIVASALDKKAVERVYKIKGRNPKKPVIILISKIKDIENFGITLDKNILKIFHKYWPGKVSIVLDCKSNKFKYLHRGTNTLAFRLPNKQELINILKKTGPLIAPSCNPEGFSPAKNIKEAKVYFGENVDYYLSGKTSKKASRIIKIENNEEVFEIRK